MKNHKLWLLITAAACGTALAGSPDQPVKPGDTAPPAAPTQDAKARRDHLLKAVQLPKKADEVRAKGVPPADMKEALEAAKAKGVKPHEMSDLTDVQSKSIDEHGRIDNFGSFVKGKLNEGLRGQDLAAAIRAEHAKRGIGKSHKDDHAKSGKPDAGDDHKGKPDSDKDADKPKGKPDDKAKGKGKPHGTL